MDAKNDDSAGSDSLDKSLQKKCVVDDVGQGEGLTANPSLTEGISDRNDKQKSDTEAENRPAISINSQNKTEKSAGDGVCGNFVENSCRIDGKCDSSILSADITNETKTPLVVDSHDAANAAKVKTNAVEGNTCTRSSDDTAISNNIVNDAAEAPSESNSNSSNNSTNSNSNCSSNNSYAFETKVKQISKNLKETTLAECANKKASTDDTNSTSSASSASSTPECEQPTIDAATAALYSLGPSTSAAAAAAAAAAAGGASAQDEHDHRSKKVRFHPDVKENDGGNRIMPKKKKKLKTIQFGASTAGSTGSAGGGDEASGRSQRGTSGADDMEFDEEEYVEEEECFSASKMIEDAIYYLMEHPLTFAGSFDKSNVTTQSGLLEEEDLPQLSETPEDDEEDFCGQEFPENGVACILGKQNKCGKVEFLLRYIDRPGLFWETEEFIGQRCPNLLNQYEQCRERRQARLMNFVAKRQNLRQRYTDF
ncbi:homeobox protein prospero [Anastrepha obliqua]|uniref:homeobox protein prospero n=1 Tax=Anastrepha obliqua TaxID=95512 RepID=UPI0024091140|nr:homeobox protein prospero [Anastrepha obliqua]